MKIIKMKILIVKKIMSQINKNNKNQNYNKVKKLK